MADHYRQLLSNETAYLNDRILKFTQILEELTSTTTTTSDSVDSTSQAVNNGNSSSSPTATASPEVIESVIGRIRLAIGQSNLFINERFRQFRGLIEDCEAKRGEKAILVEDLAGFWDMIYYQVEDLKRKYADLERAQQNGWIEENAAAANGVTNGVATNGGGDLKENGNGVRKAPVLNGNGGGISKSNGVLVNNGKQNLGGGGGGGGKPATANGTNGTASNGAVKKPAAAAAAAPPRSNIREFLKSKRKEMTSSTNGVRQPSS